AQLASTNGPPSSDPASRIQVRTTAPPAQPLAESSGIIYRGQAPDAEFGGGWSRAPNAMAIANPGRLPDMPVPAPSWAQPGGYPPERGQPTPPSMSPPGVRLGPPQPLR